MREIILTQGKYAQVDDADYEWLSQFRWYYGNGYAMRGAKNPETDKFATALMHHEIIKPSPGHMVDHINGRGTDNQRANLRICTHAQNMANRRPNKGRRFKGVHWNKNTREWQVHICVDGRQMYLGSFDSPVDGARAYDKAAREHFGEFAWLNFPNENAAA